MTLNSLVGQTVSHYKILERLGGGGMGVVYKAQDLKLGRYVALKFLPPELTLDPDARIRFVHEARAASALQHENICVIHDIDQTTDEQTYIVLEFYDGGTIKKEIARGPLPIDQAVDIAIQVGEGLAEAHRHGIVHRDIKPANVMLTGLKKARIVDFGVALLSGSTRLTSDGNRVGTVTHMSPEQTRGDPVDHRTDIWSLGVLLYEMISGRLPFGGSYEQAVVYSILNADPPPVSSLRPEAPPRLDAILGKALAKNPASRYQNVMDMVEDLRVMSGRAAGSGATVLSTVALAKTTQSRLRVLTPVLVVLFLIAASVWFVRKPGAMEPAGRTQVALRLQAIKNESGRPAADQWALLVQQSYIPNVLADQPDVLLFQGTSARGEVNFDINGEIARIDTAFILQVRLQDPETGRLRYCATSPFQRADELENSASTVSRNILWFLQVRVLNQDLEPWMPRMLSDSATVAFLKAMTYIFTGETGGGVFLYEAIRLEPSFVAPRVWLIPSLVGRNTAATRKEAEAHYKVLESLRSRVTPFELAMIDLAGCYMRGDIQCRVNALEMGLRFAPANRIVLENLGGAYVLLEKFDQAADAFEPVVRSGMPYPPAYPEYARVLIKTKRVGEVRSVLEKALALRPIDPDAYTILAAFALKDGDSAKAASYEVRYLEERTKRHAGWRDVCESVARILIDMQEPKLAANLLRGCVVEHPEIASAHSALSRALVASGDTAGGAEEAGRALALDGSCTEAHALLGQLLLQRGLPEQAIVHLRHYLERDSVTITALDFKRRLGGLEAPN